jgi:ubiquinone/menaquinone biosynthesis C-methylase UbiE
MSTSFDAAATNYDSSFTDTFTGRGQRNVVWNQLDKIIKNHPKKVLNILEINCGTGEDAIHLANQGHQVLATDISTKMIEAAHRKLKKTSSFNLAFDVLDSNQLEKIEDKFDMVFSNFGGLNCLSPDQFKELSKKVAHLLNPKGVFVAVIMSRKCAWEQLYFLAKRDSSKSNRRLSKDSLDITVDGSVVSTWFYSPKEIVEMVNDQLKHQITKPVGIGYPPSYLNPLVEKFPMLKGVSLMMEDLFGNSSALANRADHFLITFTKE